MLIEQVFEKLSSMTTPATLAGSLATSDDLDELRAVIDGLQAVGVPAGRSPGEYDALLTGYDCEIRRLQALKLGVVAAADAARVADHTGLSNTSSWVARRTHADPASASREVRLATALSPAVPGAAPRPCADALSQGALSPAHARVIVQATEQLPVGLAPSQVETVERDLIDKAARLAPDQLRRAARRALEVVEADQALVDRHEDALLRSEEAAALVRTKLTLHDNGDGTTSGHFTVPTVAAAILTRVIQSLASPRRARLGATLAQAGDAGERRDWSHQAGLAFTELLEHLPTDRLHGKVAATVVVTIDHDRLQAAVGAAQLDTGDSLSAGALRRLACGAGILPAVLGGSSLPLDLGRSSRLFNDTQRVALATRHRACAADGCERPYAWCELHHEIPWSHGGPTDLDQAVPLCGFHHRRIHDPDYEHTFGPDGITFRRRRSDDRR